jgi:4-amino-4-deoxy-L-arabinose transferase-like glycosyltransferase
VSIALGALTLVGVFSVAQRLLRNDRLALLSMAFVAFIPQFVYGAALVNNDALAACAATWLLYALLRLMNDGRWRWAWLSGGLLGITLLSKIGMIAVLPIPAMALLLYALRNTQRASVKQRIVWCVVRGAVIYSIALLIAGARRSRSVLCGAWCVVRLFTVSRYLSRVGGMRATSRCMAIR